jgi:hypothetical protein
MIQLFTAKKFILVFIFSLLIGIPLTSHANCDVTLQWDANNPAIGGYQVFGREEGQNYDYDVPWWQGDSTFDQCTIDSLDENKTYFFVVRAFVDDLVSDDSNEVRYAYSDGSSALSYNNNSSSADGGSGSGCFIQSLYR